jgi:hypothetical protein
MIGALVAGITGSGGASLSSYESIATYTGSGNPTFIEFTSIPSTFKHLQIRTMARDIFGGSGTDNFNLRFNSDTASNYAIHRLQGDGASATASGTASTTSVSIIPSTILDGSTANIFAVSIIDILDYGSTSKNKTVRYLSGGDLNGSGRVSVGSGLWMSTSAVTTIRLTTGGTGYSTPSSFALYGIKEA